MDTISDCDGATNKVNAARYWRGFVDGIRNGAVFGWLLRDDDSDAPMEVEVRLMGVLLGRTLTDETRSDVASLVGRQVTAGFRFRLNTAPPEALGEVVRALERSTSETMPLAALLEVYLTGTSEIVQFSRSAKAQRILLSELADTLHALVPPTLHDLDNAPGWRGCLDGLREGTVFGWALVTEALRDPVEIEVLLCGESIGRTRTGDARRDVAATLGQSVSPGFSLPINVTDDAMAARIIMRLRKLEVEHVPASAVLRARIAGTTFSLPSSSHGRQPSVEVRALVEAVSTVRGWLLLDNVPVTGGITVRRAGGGGVAATEPCGTAIHSPVCLAASGEAIAVLLARHGGDAMGTACLRFRPDGYPGGPNEGMKDLSPARTLQQWMIHFGLSLDTEMLARRRPVYRGIARQARDWGDGTAIPELYLSSMRRMGTPIDPYATRDLIVARFFDAAHYRNQCGMALSPDRDPLAHYLETGAAKNLDPHPLFSNAFVRTQLISRYRIEPEHQDPFCHFLARASALDLDPHPAFSSDWYREKYDLPPGVSPWLDYVDGGWHFGREPNALFMTALVARALGVERFDGTTSPLAAFLGDERCANLTPHPLLPATWGRARYLAHLNKPGALNVVGSVSFDAEGYRRQTAGLPRRRAEGFEHYLIEGERRGFRPNMLFDPAWYRRRYCYLSDTTGPLLHFLTEGEKRYRNPSALFDTRRYVEENIDVALRGTGPSHHFLVRHAQEPRRRPSMRFDSQWYRDRAPTGLGHFGAFVAGGPITPVAPHPALHVATRTAHGDLMALLQAEPGDRSLLPLGVTSVFAPRSPDRRATRGEVMQEIEAFEAERIAADHVRLARLRRDEPILRQYQLFDEAEAAQVRLRAREAVAAMASRPLVSVIMPARNRASVIERAIRSVLSQSYAEFELLVVDDGSTDGTAIVSGATGDTRVRVIRIPPSGVSAARNAGIERATGVYLAYLDSDNTWERSHLETMVAALAEAGVDLAHAALRAFNGKGAIRYRGDIYDAQAMDRENYIDMNVFAHHRKVTDAGLRFDTSLKRCVDWDFIRRACLQFGASHYVPTVGCNYFDDSETLERITSDELPGDFYRLSVAQMNLEPHVTGRASGFGRPAYSLIWPIEAAEETAVASDLWQAAHHLRRGRHELIVVANNLSDRTTALLNAMSRRVEGMRVIHLWRSFMNTPAAMLALRIARADNLLLWGSHVGYNAEAIEAFMRRAAESGAPVTFPAIIDGRNSFTDGPFAVAPDGSGLVEVLAGQVRPRGVSVLKAVGNAHAPVAISTAHLKSLGGFDYDYALALGLSEFVVRSIALDPASVELDVGRALTQKSVPRTPGQPSAIAKERSWFDKQVRLPVGVAISVTGVEDRRVMSPRSRFRYQGTGIGRAPSALPMISHRTRPGGLRFKINCPAPDDATRPNWGDWHYAESLATALRAAGQTVAIRLRDHWSATAPQADVVLHIRGIVEVKPVDGALNVIWVISHPEKLGVSEVEAADLVVASSAGTARFLRERYGIIARVLPQATDRHRFAFMETPPRPELANRLLFVGNSRRQARTIVLDAAQHDLPVDVYGTDWEFFLPERMIRSRHVPNEMVAAYYRSASAVLNDHWPWMARLGILSNRLYDVVACGGVAISDVVDGIEETFGGHVRSCTEAAGLVDLVTAIPDWAPPLAARRDRSRDILEHHSFDRRAQQIVDLVHEI